jgi:hypothetical protein
MQQLTHTTIDVLDQADDDILTGTLSDEALEAATGTAGLIDPYPSFYQTLSLSDCC